MIYKHQFWKLIDNSTKPLPSFLYKKSNGEVHPIPTVDCNGRSKNVAIWKEISVIMSEELKKEPA